MTSKKPPARKITPSRIMFALVSAFFALSLMLILGTLSRDVGVLKMRISLEPARVGRSEFALTPFGRVIARTHSLPVAVVMSVEDISVSGARKIVDRGWDVRKIFRQMKWSAAKLFVLFALKLLLLGIIGGALGASIGRRITARSLAAGGAAGGAAVLLFFLALYIDFNPAAFNEMEYSGAMNDLAYFLPKIEEVFSDGSMFKEKLEKAPGRIALLYKQLDTRAGAQTPGDTIRVLHISDLHNNPIAAQMVCRLNKTLRPDIVLDTGDISDFGIPIELNMLKSLKCITVPHVFVSGNHDLPKLMAQLHRDFGITVLDGTAVELQGLRILGFGTPAPFPGASIKAGIRPGRMKKFRERITKTLAAQPRKPDIFMVHYPSTARKFAGAAPVMLDGHDHEASITRRNGSMIINSGTTGAAGARNLLNVEKSKYSVALLTFSKSSKPPKFLYADIVTVNERTGNFSLKRASAQKPKK